MCHPEVDYARTVSNDIIEVLQALGIEAARNALLKEVRGAPSARNGGGRWGSGWCSLVGRWWDASGAGSALWCRGVWVGQGVCQALLRQAAAALTARRLPLLLLLYCPPPQA